MNNLPAKQSPAEVMEAVLIKGDLAKLTPEERNSYYGAVCQSVGLNPLTKPFEYITLNGKLRLYALKDCTDQLRSLHKISVTDMTETEREGLSVVKTKVQNAEGRTDMAIGAVHIAGLKGEALANALMKAETKSKRRATLSICGLGMLDETEVDDIPDSQKRAPAPVQQQRRVPSPSEVEKVKDYDTDPIYLQPFAKEKFPEWADRYIESIKGTKSAADLGEWAMLNSQLLDTIADKAPQVHVRIITAVQDKAATFSHGSDKYRPGDEVQVQGTVPPPKDDPISSGPITTKREGPSMEGKGYDDRFTWALDKIRHGEDGGWLETFWSQQIEPDAKEWMPPDYQELAEEYGKRIAALNADGS